MSASDRVRISYIEQDLTELDTVPPTGNFRTARILSDTLSGTPNVLSDDEAGSGDRMSGAASIVGLEVGGGFSIKLSPDPFHDDMIEAAMKSAWGTPVVRAITDIVAATGVITGTGLDGFSEGDLVVISTSTIAANNVPVYIQSIASPTSMTVVAPDGFADESAVSLTITRPAYVQIGTEDSAFFFAKDFLDLTDKEIAYFGQVLDGFEFNLQFKQHITGSYKLAGTNWGAPVTPHTNGRTVTPIGTQPLLNASQDMGLVLLDGQKTDFCIQSLKVSLSNNLSPDDCVGRLAPKRQTAGDAEVKAAMSAYLADSNFDLVRDRMDHVPVEVLYYTRNSDGLGYGFHIPALRLSFSDPANSGKNTKSMLEMDGMAEKGGAMDNLLRVYKF